MVSVLWSELLPYQFKRRLAEAPIVYLPLGICEPHGQISAFGLDTIKAEWLCQQAARHAGGIVAPALGYQIHESGYHARWLEDTVGEHNAHMTGMPPHVMLHFFLYQLRAFANAGFRGIVVISGHSGGNQIDYRRAAALFEQTTGIRVWVASDPELVDGLYDGDHAGKYEISQLMYLRPELVDTTKADLAELPGAGGLLAIGEDASEASGELGEKIMDACLSAVVTVANEMIRFTLSAPGVFCRPLTYEDIETMMQQLRDKHSEWVTMKPLPGQFAVSEQSQWKPYEHVDRPWKECREDG